MTRTVVVGAGISGLVAARRLAGAGHDVTVLDKGAVPGGRLSTSRVGAALLDDGAQFFTVRGEGFRALVDEWAAAGAVREWCRGFSVPDGHPRWVGTAGMAGLAAHLAAGLDVRCAQFAFSVGPHDGAMRVVTDDAASHTADAVVLTAPVPQSGSLLFGAGVSIPEGLRRTEYARTIALLVALDSDAHGVPAPGGLQDPGGGIQFIGDNRAKGVSEVPALTFHFTPEVSVRLHSAPAGVLENELLARAAPWLGRARVVESKVRRWRFATPLEPWPEPCLVVPGLPCVLAGDAFAGPTVERAAMSGLAAAERVLSLV